MDKYPAQASPNPLSEGERNRGKVNASEITDAVVWKRRRLIMAGMGAMLTNTIARAADATNANEQRCNSKNAMPSSTALPAIKERTTAQQLFTEYNNFYEFGTNKKGPKLAAKKLKTDPWVIKVDGEVLKPNSFSIDELCRLGVEERLYRFRCVEAWSAVVPWLGVPLAKLIEQVQPTGNAKFVEFISLADGEQMPYVRTPVLNWPYREGLRLDEALHPLTLLAVGLYGETLPPQNGAPVRLVVPWKYGFKSAKSIVHIRFLEQQPVSVWTQAQASEYGFYANVNPAVPHPRWRQDEERPLGSFRKIATLPFNGYAEQVADLYRGMDLSKNY